MTFDSPEAIEELIHLAHCAASDLLGVTPDLTPDTLPLLDAVLKTEAASAPAARRRDLLYGVAAHFGEVARTLLDGQWSCPSPDPKTWRIQLRGCFLHFSPLGMAAEVMLGLESPEYDGAFGTLATLHHDLEEMLAAAAPMSDDAYYSLGGRIEVLQLVTDWLTSSRLVEGKGRKPEPLTAEDYLAEVREKR